MQNPELIGVVVSVVEGERIQLLDDRANSRYTVRRLKTDGGIETDPKYYAYTPGEKQKALGLALGNFVDRVKAEREGIQDLVPVEEYALLLSPSGTPTAEGYEVYRADGKDVAESIAQAEDLALKDGKYDIEALRDRADYSASISSLLSSAEGVENTGIALIIR